MPFSCSFSRLMKTLAMVLAIAALFGLLFMVKPFHILANRTPNRIAQSTIKVHIDGQGAVVGNYDTTAWTTQTFMQFKGIPYAEPPSGRLRFKPAVPRRPWSGLFDATNFGRRCPVITSITSLSKRQRRVDLEDCLNLCVYTKDLTAKQPVMIYLYGGGFYNGSSSDFPPNYLLEKDIVLVVPHYRVGALGWLSTLTKDLPGNAPLTDVLLVLAWVRNHIMQFGGDPEHITLMGQSAGSGITSALILSPRTPQGAFHNAIIQSGSIYAWWGNTANVREQVIRICERLGCENCRTNRQLNRCMQHASILKLLKASSGEFFGPMIGDLNGILPLHPAEIMRTYDRHIPIMTGFTQHDGTFSVAMYYDGMKSIGGQFENITVRQFTDFIMAKHNDSTQLANNLQLRLLFTPKLLDSMDHHRALPSYIDLASILAVKSPVVALASQLLAKPMAADVYLYSFDYVGEYTRFYYGYDTEHYPFYGGVHHSNENIYLYATHKLNAADTHIAKRMVELWTSFAQHSVPHIDAQSPMPRMTSGSGPYFRINTNMTIEHDVLTEFTRTIDDPENYKLIRENVPF